MVGGVFGLTGAGVFCWVTMVVLQLVCLRVVVVFDCLVSGCADWLVIVNSVAHFHFLICGFDLCFLFSWM